MTNLVYLINCDVNEISKIDVFRISPLIYQGEPKKKKYLTDSSVSHKLFLGAGKLLKQLRYSFICLPHNKLWG